MADNFKAILNRIVDTWNNWTAKQRIIIIASVTSVLVAIGLIAFVVTRPVYETLVVCEDYKEMNSVTSALSSNGISYNVEDHTMTVGVKKADLTNAKMLIASEDIQPSGYTFEDAMNSSFTTTESDRTKMYAHYLENKFKADLELIDGIKNASVTVALEDSSSSFYATTAEAAVSVCIDTSRSLDESIAESIANLLATGVGNSTTDKITIIDTKGNTLFSGPARASSNAGISYTGKMKYKNQIESTVKNDLRQGLLASGQFDDVYLTLNMDMDWDAVTTIATEYSTQGDEQAIFSNSYREVSNGVTGASGTPGTSSNDDDTTYNINTGAGSTSSYEVEKYEYLPNSIVTTTVREPGEIVYDTSSLAVTLVRNMVYKEEECRRLGYLDDMTWEEFRAQNADTVPVEVDENIIENISRGTGVPAANISVIAYQRPWFEDRDTGDIMNTATFWLQIVLAVVILGLLGFVVIRSAKPITVEETEPEISVEEMIAATRENQPKVDDVEFNDKSEARKAIEKFVDEKPEAVALLLRNWLNEGWE